MSAPVDARTGAVAAAAALLATARDVTLLAHVQPDADALGSALALGIALHRRGVRVRVSFAEPDRMPESLRSLDALGLVVPADDVPAAPEVLVACDTAGVGRLGRLADRLDTAGATLLIDHHASNPGFGNVQLVDASVEATVVLVHRVLVEMGVPVDEEIARCLYAGLVTDTVGFRTAGPAAHRLAATLVEAGVEVEPLVRPIMGTHPFAWLAALADVLRGASLEPEAAGGLGLVHAVIPAPVVARFRPEEVDSVIDEIRTAAEAEIAATLKQVGPRRWSVSLRAKGGFDVAAAATALGGGGHRNAAGFTRDGTAAEVLHALRVALAPDAAAGHTRVSAHDG
ncbi:DHH family phosphoesterase [Pseudonocardia bannensis]|uniref:Bifunctional oligoribonuclease/PAP phosphatase NrnA n=1 Tax=Pseudonocardia bannensis TaxID=630973 RepID=A0A848DMB1_9PSEU|nr:DHH family phosphoesterase [Pseudonocardia bannensis]NMH93571.1 bifunctional oligoribonuclease/PAP phosphatase NrnA [Pseudonocardia bannensis]